MWWALVWGCVGKVPHTDLASPAPELAATVQDVAERPLNRGRRLAIEDSLESLNLPYQTEWIDWFSSQKNVVVELPGETNEIVYVVAHYDKVDLQPLTAVGRMLNGLTDPLFAWATTSDGAVDNATGVSVVLQLAAALQELDGRRYTWRFLFAGSEEQGLRGTRAHVARLAREETDRIHLAINIDSVGVDYTATCVEPEVSADWAVDLMRDAAVAQGLELQNGSLPAIALSDHVVFAKNSFGWDFGRGLAFATLPGGLLPQRSWFTHKSSSDVLFLSGCELIDAGDWLSGLVLLPLGRLHGPRDRAERVDPTELLRAYQLVWGLADALEAGR